MLHFFKRYKSSFIKITLVKSRFALFFIDSSELYIRITFAVTSMKKTIYKRLIEFKLFNNMLKIKDFSEAQFVELYIIIINIRNITLIFLKSSRSLKSLKI